MTSTTPYKKAASVTVSERKGSGDAEGDNASTAPSLKSPRAARFAEATSVNSPIEQSGAARAPWDSSEQITHFRPEPQPGDVGFGYINDRRSQHDVPHVEMPLTPGSPLKSAMKTPGAQTKRFDTGLKSPTFFDDPEALKSPTWREEKLLEKRETRTDKIQRKDLKVKVRVRIAKLLLRFTNFSCSLIVLAMLLSTITVFEATVDLPPRNGLPAWAPDTPRWPQITLLSIASISLFASMVVIVAYCYGGKKLRNKWQTYYSVMAVGYFTFSIIMWAIGAGILHHSKANGDGKDMWGWSCKDNTRSKIFANDVNYSLLCRLMNWSLVCALIEVVVEIITILVYGIIFYRFWSKRRLRNTMAVRDKARSELYMSQMRSGANTPYTGALSPPLPYSPTHPLSPSEGGYNPLFSARFGPGTTGDAKTPAPPPAKDAQFASLSGAVAGGADKKKPFVLQAPPKKMQSPKGSADSPTFSSPTTAVASSNTSADWRAMSQPTTPRITPLGANPTANGSRVAATPAEQTYGEVPIPGAYAR